VDSPLVYHLNDRPLNRQQCPLRNQAVNPQTNPALTLLLSHHFHQVVNRAIHLLRSRLVTPLLFDLLVCKKLEVGQTLLQLYGIWTVLDLRIIVPHYI
jgi:hypothetical protein